VISDLSILHRPDTSTVRATDHQCVRTGSCPSLGTL